MNFFNISTVIGGFLRRITGKQPTSIDVLGSAGDLQVNSQTAMQLSAVWACVKLLSETIASLPLTIYKKSENGRKIDENHHLSVLFNGKVNRYQTKVEFFETLLLNLFVHGNAYCLIQRSGEKIIGLLPLMSEQMEVTLLRDGSLVYEYSTDQGITAYSEQSIWHIKLMGNGITGLSPLNAQRNTLGIALGAEKATKKIYANGAKPSGVLSTDKLLNDTQRSLLRQKYSTLSETNEDRFMILELGLKYNAVSLSPQDIELLASRQYQVSEICRFYGVPSVMVNDTSSNTMWGSGISEIVSGFYKLTLRPNMEKIEASIMSNLMTATERARREVEFDFNALTRPDQKSRYEAYRIGIYGGFLKPNEVREIEGLEKDEHGDRLFMQGANVALEDILELANKE